MTKHHTPGGLNSSGLCSRSLEAESQDQGASRVEFWLIFFLGLYTATFSRVLT